MTIKTENGTETTQAAGSVTAENNGGQDNGANEIDALDAYENEEFDDASFDGADNSGGSADSGQDGKQGTEGNGEADNGNPPAAEDAETQPPAAQGADTGAEKKLAGKFKTAEELEADYIAQQKTLERLNDPEFLKKQLEQLEAQAELKKPLEIKAPVINVDSVIQETLKQIGNKLDHLDETERADILKDVTQKVTDIVMNQTAAQIDAQIQRIQPALNMQQQQSQAQALNKVINDFRQDTVKYPDFKELEPQMLEFVDEMNKKQPGFLGNFILPEDAVEYVYHQTRSRKLNAYELKKISESAAAAERQKNEEAMNKKLQELAVQTAAAPQAASPKKQQAVKPDTDPLDEYENEPVSR